MRELTRDPHTFRWDEHVGHDEWQDVLDQLEVEVQGTVEHRPVPTFDYEVERSYRLGRHTITTTTRIITNRPPNVDTTTNTQESTS